MKQAIQSAVVCVAMLVAGQVQGDVIIFYRDSGPDLQFDYSGTLNVDAFPDTSLIRATASVQVSITSPVFYNLTGNYDLVGIDPNPPHTIGLFATNLPDYGTGVHGTGSGTTLGFRMNAGDPGPATSIAMFGDWGAANSPINGQLILTNQSAGGIGMVDGWTVQSVWGSITFKAAPEPTSMALVGLGAAGFGYFHRRKLKKLKLKQAA